MVMVECDAGVLWSLMGIVGVVLEKVGVGPELRVFST